MYLSQTRLNWQPETLSRNESGRFGALKSESIHHFFRNACTKSGSLRFSQFSGCWLILSVYILMSFDFHFVRLFGKFDQITVRSNYSSLHYPRQLIFSMQFGDRKWLFLKLILYACISNMIALTNFLFLPLTYSMNTITLYYCNICITQFDLCYKI
jgi:hypothetical protein